MGMMWVKVEQHVSRQGDVLQMRAGSSTVGMDCHSVSGFSLKDNLGGSLTRSGDSEKYTGRDHRPVHRSQVPSASSRGKHAHGLEWRK